MNKGNWLSDPAAPLRTLSAGLGDQAPDWAAREELNQLRFRNDNFSRDAAAALTLEHLVPLAEAYGDALRCRFLLGDLPALEVTPDLNEAALAAFRETTEDSPTVTFDFVLNKQALLNSWLGPAAGPCRTFLYLFPRALERLLRIPPDKLRDLEKLLWDEKPARKALILVPDHDIRLDGPYLAVIGGDRVSQWRRFARGEGGEEHEDETDEKRLAFITQTRSNVLKWDEVWADGLTPLHLKLEGDRGPDDVPIGALLEGHLLNLVILYTGDRTRRRDGRLVTNYAGAQRSVNISLLATEDLDDTPPSAGLDALLEIFEWAYDRDFYGDKLPLVQVAMTQALHAAEPEARTHLLLQNGPSIYEGLQYHWKALIEKKVDIYVSQVRALEDYVGETVQAFADQVSEMIDDLTKNMLAAVGVIVGSLVGSLFKDTFDPTVLSVGMALYGFYLVAFPLGYGLSHRWEAYEALKDAFGARRERFEALLYDERVTEIVGDRIRDSQRRFERWYARVRWAYLTLAALVALAAILTTIVWW